MTEIVPTELKWNADGDIIFEDKHGFEAKIQSNIEEMCFTHDPVISRENAAALIPVLQHFVDTGELPPPPKSKEELIKDAAQDMYEVLELLDDAYMVPNGVKHRVREVLKQARGE